MTQMELSLPTPILKQVNDLLNLTLNHEVRKNLVHEAIIGTFGYEVSLLMGPNDYAEFKHALTKMMATAPQEITAYQGFRIVQIVHNEPIRIAFTRSNI